MASLSSLTLSFPLSLMSLFSFPSIASSLRLVISYGQERERRDRKDIGRSEPHYLHSSPQARVDREIMAHLISAYEPFCNSGSSLRLMVYERKR